MLIDLHSLVLLHSLTRGRSLWASLPVKSSRSRKCWRNLCLRCGLLTCPLWFIISCLTDLSVLFLSMFCSIRRWTFLGLKYHKWVHYSWQTFLGLILLHAGRSSYYTNTGATFNRSLLSCYFFLGFEHNELCS